MTHAYYTKDVVPLIRSFTFTNIKSALFPILPYILGLRLFQIYLADTSPKLSLLVILPLAYFNALFVANLHRAYIKDCPAVAYNPLKPTRNDWSYIGMALILNLMAIMLAAGILIPAAFLGKAAIAIAFVVSLPFLIFLFVRLSLVLPNRAIGGSMKLQDSYIASKGLVWKMILTPLRASWKIIILGMAWVFIATMVFTIFIKMNNMDVKNLTLPMEIVKFIILAPYNIGVIYIITAMGITTLSHYYLWAKENWNITSR